jgi:fatty acid desaturase
MTAPFVPSRSKSQAATASWRTIVAHYQKPCHWRSVWQVVIQFTVLLIAGSSGFWLFYVQHQFEGGYWEHGDHWDYTAAALKGSSFYKLPKVRQWFSDNKRKSGLMTRAEFKNRSAIGKIFDEGAGTLRRQM